MEPETVRDELHKELQYHFSLCPLHHQVLSNIQVHSQLLKLVLLAFLQFPLTDRKDICTYQK